MRDLTPEDMEFVRDYAERNAGYAIVRPVVDFINQYLAPPRIIRTVEELKALDDDAFLMASDGNIYYAIGAKGRLLPSDIPAVVIREGAEVRAARKALEKETE